MRARPTALLLVAALAGCHDAPTANSSAELGRSSLLRIPDQRPRWFNDASYAIRSTAPGGRAGTFLRNVAVIQFRPGTVDAQVQAAVQSVHGTVVGGFRAINAFYLQLPETGSRITADSLEKVLNRLKAMPQVFWARAYDLTPVKPAYIVPVDGPGWTKSDWRLYPDSAQGLLWAPEAVAAPWAWGCSTGDAATAIAVVDNNLDVTNVADIQKNLNSGKSFGLGALAGTTVDPHGVWVASVLAASGNDTTGIAGMMWRADLRLYEAGVDSTGAVTYDTLGRPVITVDNAIQRIVKAAEDGASVINVSMEIDWGKLRNSPGYRPDTTHGAQAQADSEVVRSAYNNLLFLMATLQGENLHPLIVLAAGNDGIDAYWNAYPVAAIAADSFPGQVIVVGGAMKDNAGHLIPLDTTLIDNNGVSHHIVTNTGHLVQVMAPGGGVTALTPSGTLTSVYGTSFAAPQVTGLAGLLKSFDPRPDQTPADSLKALILRGAQRGGRTVNGTPVINAYESLRAAAEHPGAPLCGNRVWVADQKIRAQRGSSAEDLKSIGDEAGYVYVHHGGRRIDLYGDQTDSRAFLYGANGWDEGDYWSLPEGLPGGTGLSIDAISHDRDSVAYVRDDGNGQFTATIGPYPRGTQRDVNATPISVSLTNTMNTGECRRQKAQYSTDENNHVTLTGYTCIDTDMVTGTREQAWTMMAYSPLGDRLVVVLNVDQTQSTNIGQWAVCPWSGPGPTGADDEQCRSVSYSRTTTRAELYSVPLPGGSPVQHIGTISGKAVYWLGIRENSREFVDGEGTQTDTWDAVPSTSGGIGWVTVSQPQQLTGCGIQYRDGGNLSTVNPSIPSAYACFGWPGNGTIAPNRVRFTAQGPSDPSRVGPTPKPAPGRSGRGLPADRRRTLPN